jgi:hypothetical protein
MSRLPSVYESSIRTSRGHPKESMSSSSLTHLHYHQHHYRAGKTMKATHTGKNDRSQTENSTKESARKLYVMTQELAKERTAKRAQ